MNLRGGDFGRFLWTADGIGLRTVLLAANRPRPRFPTGTDHRPDGLHQASIAPWYRRGKSTGVLNDYLGRIAGEHPDRLWALATVEEWRADDHSQLAEIERAVTELGLKGLFFDTGLIGKFGRKTLPDDPCFDPFWQTVRRLDIPVFWNITSPEPTLDAWLEQQRSFGRWLARYPDVKCVYTHGLPLYRFVDDSGDITVSDEVWAPLESANVYTEILIPILMGGVWEYPYAEAQPFIRAPTTNG